MHKDTKNYFESKVSVEFEDVDSYRIAHHTKLIAYLERARVRFLTQSNIDFVDDINFVLYKLDLHFKKPAKLLDELTVRVYVKRLRAVGVTLGYEILRDNELIAKAFTELACVDPKSQMVSPLPKEYMNALKTYSIKE